MEVPLEPGSGSLLKTEFHAHSFKVILKCRTLACYLVDSLLEFHYNCIVVYSVEKVINQFIINLCSFSLSNIVPSRIPQHPSPFLKTLPDLPDLP